MAKSNYEIEFHPEAIREIREAIEWYRERDEAVATELRSHLKSAEDLVRRFPESWSEYLLETRGFRFQKFPFVFDSLGYLMRVQANYFLNYMNLQSTNMQTIYGYQVPFLSFCGSEFGFTRHQPQLPQHGQMQHSFVV